MRMERLSDAQRDEAIGRLAGWSADEAALTRTVRFADFVQAMDFVNEVADLAERHNHHPDIDIRYNRVTLRLSSHDAGGVTERDVALARAIDHLA